MLAAALRPLEVEPGTLADDEHDARIDELLAGAIVGFITVKSFHGKVEFHGYRCGDAVQVSRSQAKQVLSRIISPDYRVRYRLCAIGRWTTKRYSPATVDFPTLWDVAGQSII